ncbi:MAG: PaaI family thioesterase [SAR324 cluster bacterium]|nr:PaaI family thioesterase [SAR324 cluster bacterium]
MANHEAVDPDFERRVRDSFARQTFMGFIGAELAEVRPGFCEIRLPYRKELCQQHGFFHGGVVGTLADNVAGYSSYSLARAVDSVLTVEYKLNLLAPARGDLLIARGEVIRAGRTLVVVRSDVFAAEEGRETLCATALTTIMILADTPDR